MKWEGILRLSKGNDVLMGGITVGVATFVKDEKIRFGKE